jgi:putative membrane protein
MQLRSTFFIGIAAAALAGSLQANGKANASFNNADAMQDTTAKSSSKSMAGEEDIKFINEAASGGLAEVELGQMAQTKATDPQVKEFGAMMVQDHTKANDELKALAEKKNITLPATPSEQQRKVKDELSTKSGKDFDNAYVLNMVKDHKKDIKLFEDASKKVDDPELKAFIVKTLPTLRMHLTHVQAIEKNKK